MKNMELANERLRKELEEELKLGTEQLCSHAWYHGCLPRKVRQQKSVTWLATVVAMQSVKNSIVAKYNYRGKGQIETNQPFQKKRPNDQFWSMERKRKAKCLHKYPFYTVAP